MTRRAYIIALACATILVAAPAKAQKYQIAIPDASSLVRVGMNPHPTEPQDTALAYTLLSAIDRQMPDSIAYVRDQYRKRAQDDLLKEKSWGALTYILDRLLQQGQGSTSAVPQSVEAVDPLTEDLYAYFTDNACERLKHYLVLKYNLNNYRPRSVKEFINQRTYYDDLLMFNDPTRATWDHTADIMAAMPVGAGAKVLDMGCGFGYNTLRLRHLVGEKGTVYATDTEEPYAQYVAGIMAKVGYTNVHALPTSSNSIGITDTVDCILMSSLYHIIYTWSREDERKALLTSIKEHLAPNGYIVIVDNFNRHGEELNNCHVDPRLVQAQLSYWGFKPVQLKTLSPQRYMLVMQRDDAYVPNVTVTAAAGQRVLDVMGQKSVVHIGSLDSYDITDRGIDAASHVYDFISGGASSLAEVAIRKYDDIIPAENFGGEYTAMQWLCEALLATPEKRESMLEDPLTRSFYNYLTADSCSTLRYYLLHKYKLGNDSIRMMSDSLLEMSGEVGRTHRSYLEDYILALNPRRPTWEKTPVILESLNLQPGQVVADIGSGSGFFTHKFSKAVGDAGRVYAVEMKDEHIQRLHAFIDENKINNIEVIQGEENRLVLPQQVDKMFMCSLYHIFYGVIDDATRDAYLSSLTQWLRPDGELIIVDNGPVDDDTLPYHGPYIDRRLIEDQLSFYGFRLTDYVQVIPQRYLLKFKRAQ